MKKLDTLDLIRLVLCIQMKNHRAYLSSKRKLAASKEASDVSLQGYRVCYNANYSQILFHRSGFE